MWWSFAQFLENFVTRSLIERIIASILDQVVLSMKGWNIV